MPITPIDKKHNYFNKFNVSTTNFNDLRICWNFVSLGIALSVESNDPTDIIQYSFDGVNVHGDMTPFQSSEGIIFDNRFEDDIWFRRAAPGNSVLVRLEVWSGS